MKNNNETKLFAFKVAEKKDSAKSDAQWKVRNGVATAGCTGSDTRATGRNGARDQGMWC